MSAVVVISPDELATLVREAVRDALNDAASIRSGSEWVPCKKAPIPRTTLDGLRKKKLVRSCKIGREVFVHRGDLETWMDEQSKSAKPEVAKAMPEPKDPFEAAIARTRARRAS